MRNEERKVRGVLAQMTAGLVISVVIALAAVAVPSFSRRFDADGKTRASADVHAVAAGLARYMADTGLLPTGFHGAATYAYLRGAGETPEFAEDPGGWIGGLDWFLEKNYMGNLSWRGPYANAPGADPWGRRYVVFVGAFTETKNRGRAVAWVVSAGPNGIVETSRHSTAIMGDDIGCPVE